MPTLKMTKTKRNFPEFLQEFSKKYDVDQIEVQFSGSGDSGEIGEPEFFKLSNEEVTTRRNNDINPTKEELDTIRQFFDRYLDDTGYDWYNNDGGFGTIELDLKTGEITCDMNINEMSYETYSLSDEGNFVKNYQI